MEKEVLLNTPDNSLEIFVAEEYSEKIYWEKKDKEFILGGVMFDVVRIKKSNGKTFLYCINDKKEKQLLDNLANTVDHNNGDNKQNKNIIKSLVSDLVCIGNDEMITFFTDANQYAIINESLVTSTKEINIPPPKA